MIKTCVAEMFSTSKMSLEASAVALHCLLMLAFVYLTNGYDVQEMSEKANNHLITRQRAYLTNGASQQTLKRTQKHFTAELSLIRTLFNLPKRGPLLFPNLARSVLDFLDKAHKQDARKSFPGFIQNQALVTIVEGLQRLKKDLADLDEHILCSLEQTLQIISLKIHAILRARSGQATQDDVGGMGAEVSTQHLIEVEVANAVLTGSHNNQSMAR